MKILLHTQYYPPEIGAPQNRLSDLASELLGLGIEVEVLTAMPNYPTGKIFSNYGGFYRSEIVDNIKTHRSWIVPSQSPSLVPRLLNYFSFVFSSFAVGLFLPKFDFIITESPPLFLGISGYLLSRIKNARWVFNISDLWPSSAVELGVIKKDSVANKISESMEGYLYRKAWLVTGQSKTILSNIHHRFPETITYHLSNGVNTKLFKKSFIDEIPSGKIKIIYAGLHGLAQGLDKILLGISHLSRSQDVDVLFMGDGPEKQKLKALAKSLKMDNIEFRDPIPKTQVPIILSSADILLVPLKIQLTGAVPSKLYESMAMGKPVLLVAEDEAKNIVETSKCGLVVKPGDVDEITKALEFLMDHPETCHEMGANGRRMTEEFYNRSIIAKDFSQFLISHSQEGL